jgi:putative zinc finger/helix-turn-helix YgiT family protein
MSKQTELDDKIQSKVPDNACPECGTLMERTDGPMTARVNGEAIRVPSVPRLKCPSCGEGLLSLKEAKHLETQAMEIYREKYGLLTAAEIKTLREQHGMTQAELAQLLRLGANTISRWESGRVVQSAALDTLLRLIRDIPGTIDYLRDRAA